MHGGCCWWKINAEDRVVVPRSTPTPTLALFMFGPVLVYFSTGAAG
jgi:hypothetical protein